MRWPEGYLIGTCVYTRSGINERYGDVLDNWKLRMWVGKGGCILVCLDKKRAHPVRRLHLGLKLACRLVEIPKSVVICSGMGYTKLLNIHSGTEVPDQLNNPVHVPHAVGILAGDFGH